MKKYIISLLFVLITIQGFSQAKKIKNKNDSLTSVTTEQIKEIKTEFDNYKKEISSKIEYQNQTLTLSTNSTSTSLTALNNYLDLWGIIFGIFGILIGSYVIWVQNRMSNILKDARGVLAEQKEIQREVNNTQELIENDLTGLYLKLENQEVKIMLDRLKKNPEELINLFKPLATKVLSTEHYCSLKEIGLKCFSNEIEDSLNNRINIATLLFQHYPDKVLFDKDLNFLIFPNLEKSINNLFLFEIIDSTTCIIKYAVNRDIQNYKEILNLFYKAIKESDKFEIEDIYSKSYDSCLSKESKFKLFEIIESNEKFTEVFGNKLLNEFKNDKNSDEQRTILEGIK